MVRGLAITDNYMCVLKKSTNQNSFTAAKNARLIYASVLVHPKSNYCSNATTTRCVATISPRNATNDKPHTQPGTTICT